jgi:UDP-N-acetylmuramoyl-L-alanyl-D-glutamate--2,6-diaminopimelate ligase
MGRAADEGADIVVVTSDNPRDEPPEGVIADILVGMERERAGAPGGEWTLLVEPDRRAAIAAAIDRARPGDLVLVAGKGHERTQEVAGEHLPFDDSEVAGELLANRDPGR